MSVGSASADASNAQSEPCRVISKLIETCRSEAASPGRDTNPGHHTWAPTQNAASPGRDTNRGHNFDFECRPVSQSLKFAAHIGVKRILVYALCALSQPMHKLFCQTEECKVDPLVVLNRNVTDFFRCLVVWETKGSKKRDCKKCTVSLGELCSPSALAIPNERSQDFLS